MKKLAVTLLLFAFIAGPTFAMKVITNKDTDRTVPSRCMRPGYDATLDANGASVYYTPGETRSYGGVKGYQAIRFNQYYKPVLSRDMRYELIGTRWHYPDYTVQTAGKVTVKGDNGANKALLKPSKYMREAADYYVVDTINNPNMAVEAKHEGYYQ